MSYLKDLEEYTDAELEAEIRRRRSLMFQGLCSYCGRRPSLTPCRFPERHNDPRLQERGMHRDIDKTSGGYELH